MWRREFSPAASNDNLRWVMAVTNAELSNVPPYAAEAVLLDWYYTFMIWVSFHVDFNAGVGIL